MKLILMGVSTLFDPQVPLVSLSLLNGSQGVPHSGYKPYVPVVPDLRARGNDGLSASASKHFAVQAFANMAQHFFVMHFLKVTSLETTTKRD